MPISMKSGVAALRCSVPTSTPTALATPGTRRIRANSPSSMVLDRMSDTPFCTTVMLALPTEITAAADCSRLVLDTCSVTTMRTANAMVNASPIDRAFFAHTPRSINAR